MRTVSWSGRSVSRSGRDRVSQASSEKAAVVSERRENTK